MNDTYITLIAVLVIVICSYFLLQTKYKRQIASMLLYLVAEAETQFGAKTGQLKYSAVSTWIYDRIPYSVRFFVTSSMIDKMIEEAVAQLKAYLENNAEAMDVVSK